MTTLLTDSATQEARYRGLRMTADEYFQLEDDGFRYELVDGVVCMTPSPSPTHQSVAARLAGQITHFLEKNPVGEAFVEVDVYMGVGPNGRDLVYRADLVYLRAERVEANRDRIVDPPDLVVEIISSSSRRYDSETKKGDYERRGIGEYWLIDPERRTMNFYQLERGRYVEMTPDGDTLRSRAIPGFTLDLVRVRRSFNL